MDAPSTLSLAKKHKPAVVILDAAIPGDDAFELVTKLAKSLPATKVVFATEIDNPTYMARARAVLSGLVDSPISTALIAA